MKKQNKSIIGIIMGSDSDLVVMQEAAKILDQFQVSYEVTIVSAHRTPDRLFEYASSAESRGLKIIIAGAGGAAHLPGMTAALTVLPVIGVPIMGKTLKGVDSFLSIAQMPPGVPVATMAINGAKNAGLLALKIMALADESLREALKKSTQSLNKEVKQKARKLEKVGYQNYLERKN
ncbi:5-(carboxyamino)imidazole ribonucleotide mutase [Candidatus Azambacteria bacterium]|nr:5-(carboxyamino)imidazole ribonucleotide mutase [Candidatus Azambacteria bacterium]